MRSLALPLSESQSQEREKEMSASVIAWMTTVQQLLLLAPNVISFAAKVQRWIRDLRDSNLITAQDQDALMRRVDDICRAVLNGNPPEHWQIEPDPE